MTPIFRHITATFIFVLAALTQSLMAQDENDTDIRLNPELGVSASFHSSEAKYPYIRYDLNTITMNGDNWKELANKLEQSRTRANFTIVHIGDSHIQADGNTGTTRKLFQKEYGDAGRGIIVPFKLAGTNEPLDYSFTSDAPFVKSTLMRQPWAYEPGFTGVSLHPEEQQFSMSVKIKSECGYFTILAQGDIDLVAVTSGGKDIGFETERVDDGLDVSLDTDVTEMTLTMTGNDVNIYGLDLRNDNNGVLYHAIGNNGAAYSSYNILRDFGKSLSILEPDLVILSLGTNEAFGKLEDETFKAQVMSMVRKIRKNMPGAKILLTTPSECQRSSYTTVRKGKGKRRRTTKTKTFTVNSNVERVRNLILEIGRENHIPVYDFYAVAGGQGASAKWLEDKLLNTDRIHRTWEGYRVEGELTYKALMASLKK